MNTTTTAMTINAGTFGPQVPNDTNDNASEQFTLFHLLTFSSIVVNTLQKIP